MVAALLLPVLGARLADVEETNISPALESEPILALQEPMRPAAERRRPPTDIAAALLRAQDYLDRHADDRDAYLRVGSLFLLSGRVEDAATVYWWAARRWPQDVVVLDNFGAALLATGDGGSAAVVYDRLVQDYPTNQDYRFNFAAALYELGAYEQSRQQWQKLLEEDLSELRRPKVLYNLAMTELAMGNTNAALEKLEAAYRAQPDNPFALCAQARIYARLNQVDKMLKCLQQVKRMLTPADFSLIVRHPVFRRWEDDPAFTEIIGQHSQKDAAGSEQRPGPSDTQ